MSLACGVPVAQGGDPMTVTGTLVSLNETSLVVQTDKGERRAFTIDAQTELPVEGLSVGARVSVLYKQLDDSSLLAIGVAVLDSLPPPSTGSARRFEPITRPPLRLPPRLLHTRVGEQRTLWWPLQALVV